LSPFGPGAPTTPDRAVKRELYRELYNEPEPIFVDDGSEAFPVFGKYPTNPPLLLPLIDTLYTTGTFESSTVLTIVVPTLTVSDTHLPPAKTYTNPQ
jgi:hypothetical protein